MNLELLSERTLDHRMAGARGITGCFCLHTY